MKIIRLKDLKTKEYQRIIKRSSGSNTLIKAQVVKIMENVREKGDRVIMEKYQTKYGKGRYRTIAVSSGEIKEAYRKIGDNLIKSLKQMIKNITAVHRVQLEKKIDKIVRPEIGILVWREWRAIGKVGLYIPGGKAVYPSSVLMSAIPAKIAGCREIIMCSPPDRFGNIPAATLVAADMMGIKKIFKVGGAEAIAALAYSTESIPGVYKIFGAGNSYVTIAKMIALETVAIDMPAGPSEIFIIADESADPGFIAADLIADGEHGEDSACVLLTDSEKTAKETILEINNQLKKLSTAERVKESLKKYGLIALVDNLNEAVNFSNNYAPEHLELMVKNPEAFLGKITNAGSVFLGSFTTKSAGDYATGANHVLPTGSMAKMYPPLGVEAYGKWMQVQKCSKAGLGRIRQTIETVAETEQLPGHRNATSIRFN